MMNKKLIIAVLSAALINQAALADDAPPVISADISNATLSALPSCLHYRVLGACYWLSEYGGVTTTPYVEHYLPDVVVSVFNKPGDNAWAEMNATLDPAGKIAEQQIISSITNDNAGSGQHTFYDPHEQGVYFKEAEIIGDPALALLPEEGLLPSTATPLKPYYQSMLDAALWRGMAPTSMAEESYALGANLTHHIGNTIINWGGIYPHEGKIVASNDAKAAAVIAQRSGDLITSTDTAHYLGHIYQALSTSCGQQCTAAPIQENSSKAEYQMIYPVQDSRCDYFGKTLSYGNDIENKTHGAYVWVVWRYYQGCIDGDGKFIGKTIT